MCNVLPIHKKLSVLHHLVEGNSIRSTERLTGVHRDTIMRLLVRTGEQCHKFLVQRMQNLSLRHVQVDELWTFVQKKQGRLTIGEQDNPSIGDIYLWVALDEDTKLVAGYIVGKRTADMARRFMRDLASRLTRPKPHASDDHGFVAGGYRPTPAMAAGVTDRLWSITDLYDAVAQLT